MPNKDGRGWTVLAAALTNTPRARQRDNPISIVEKDGAEFLRVPLIKKCRIRYKGKLLTFGQKEFDTMLQNHKDRVWDFPPYIRVGHRDSPGLAWFAQTEDESPSGHMTQEDDWLVAYALPTDDDVRKAKRGYKYSSIDIHPDYSSNQLELTFSSQDFEEITEEEGIMTDDGKITLSKEEYQALTSKNAATEVTIKLQAQVDALAAEKVSLEAEKADLEKKRVSDRHRNYLNHIQSTVELAKARRGEDGKSAIPAFILNTIEQIMKFDNVGSGSEIITLDKSGSSDISEYVDYVSNSLSYFLANMPIESMPTSGSTNHKEDKPGKEKIKFGMGEKELDEFYSSEAKDFWPEEVTQ